ncbi:hypothetical protein ANN_12782 [Periplaneta americana]|uniref:Reverse transcriptase zinc-binding domain-containing protein n=1 Tax=Periplaneta americana TaxID=6978 RepID=A0ABQ8TJR4_PERAM|nr:hypothetical protein ANN_12782 [Periplaneta americana]
MAILSWTKTGQETGPRSKQLSFLISAQIGQKRNEKRSCINYWSWSLQETPMHSGTQEPMCRMCKQKEETASHILFDCPFLERQRFSLSITMDINVGAKILLLVKGTEFERQC